MAPILLSLLACTDPGDTSTRDSTAPAPTCDVAIEEVVVTDNPLLVLEKRFQVTLDRTATAWVTCTADRVPEELHLAESSEPDTAHDFVLHGLLGDTAYTCTVSAPCGEGGQVDHSEEVLTAPLPASLPTFVASRGEHTTGHYTLFNDADVCNDSDQRLVIVDDHGRVRWYHDVPEDLDMDLDAHLTPDGHIYYGGGWGLMDFEADQRGLVRVIDLSGAEQLLRTAPAFGISFNHHSEPRPDGTQMSLTSDLNQADGLPFVGVGAEIYDPIAGEVLWSWSSQQAVDAGTLPPPDRPGSNPYWANSMSLVDEPDGTKSVYLSFFAGDQIVKVDYDTGEIDWIHGAEGDFTLIDAQGEPEGLGRWHYSQHDPEIDGDRILMHDNGGDRPGDPYSRAVEFTVDESTMTSTITWEYTEDGWLEPIIGDADRLDNGNVLITMGHCACCWWALGEDHWSALVEVDPATNTVDWRLDWPDDSHGSYRSERLGGSDLFANAATCPAVADRVEALR